MINYFDGEIIRLPSKKEYRDYFMISIVYYLKEVQGYDWGGIYSILDLTEKDKEYFSPISIGRRVKKIKESIDERVINLLDSLDEKEVDKIIIDLKKED
jgi:hypothetical protein